MAARRQLNCLAMLKILNCIWQVATSTPQAARIVLMLVSSFILEQTHYTDRQGVWAQAMRPCLSPCLSLSLFFSRKIQRAGIIRMHVALLKTTFQWREWSLLSGLWEPPLPNFCLAIWAQDAFVQKRVSRKSLIQSKVSSDTSTDPIVYLYGTQGTPLQAPW